VPQVLGIGAACVDLIASVSKYPNPDDKIRSNSFLTVGGGNCANTLVGASRLGLQAAMVTKLGDDANACAVIAELEGEGVQTQLCKKQKGLDTPFTYIIVDESSATRTCIHTPIREEVQASEVCAEWLDDVALLHSDSRHTRAAITLARLAVERSIPVVVDAEKPRPHFDELLPLVDVVCTNSRFPALYAPEKHSLEEQMLSILLAGRAHTVVTTLGAQGSMLLRRASDEGQTVSAAALQQSPDILSYSEWKAPGGEGTFHVWRCAAWPPSSIVDPTGALYTHTCVCVHVCVGCVCVCVCVSVCVHVHVYVHVSVCV